MAKSKTKPKARKPRATKAAAPEAKPKKVVRRSHGFPEPDWAGAFFGQVAFGKTIKEDTGRKQNVDIHPWIWAGDRWVTDAEFGTGIVPPGGAAVPKSSRRPARREYDLELSPREAAALEARFAPTEKEAKKLGKAEQKRKLLNFFMED